MVDAADVDPLIDRLVKLKNENKNHLHICDVGMTSPWGTPKLPRKSSSIGLMNLTSLKRSSRACPKCVISRIDETS